LPKFPKLFAAALALTLAACGGVEERRIRELLNEKGFGSRAEGVATFTNYVTGGDGVLFYLDPTAYMVPDAERLYFLTLPQQVSIDGTILVPYVGPIYVLGKTEQDLTALVKSVLQPLFAFEINLTARIINRGKAFYAFGETLAKGRLPMVKGDLTILEAISTIGTTELANLGRIQVVRPDAQNPLVIHINIREMITTGNTTYNILLYDNDIIYVPPTFFGSIARFIEKLLQPLGVAVQALFGLATIQASYRYITDPDSSSFFFRF
jgi:protein involved in polysaccharide export with SLBB domain